MGPSLSKVALWTVGGFLGLAILYSLVQVFVMGAAVSLNSVSSLMQPLASFFGADSWEDILFPAALFAGGIALPTLVFLFAVGRRALIALLPVDIVLFLISLYAWGEMRRPSFGLDLSPIVGMPLSGFLIGITQCVTHTKFRSHSVLRATLVSCALCILEVLVLRLVVPVVAYRGLP